MNVLMVGVSKQTQGGMYTVVENYFENKIYNENVNLTYIPTSTVGTIPYRLWYTTIGLFNILKVLITKKIDIVHIHMSEKGSVYRKGIVLNLARLFKIKTITHMHGADFEDWYNSLSIRKKKSVINIINKTDKVLILGEYWKDIFSEIVNDNNKLIVLHNAVPTFEENYYNHNSQSILFLGAIIKRKGVYDLLKAIRLIDDKLPPNITFDFYGPDVNHNFNEKILDYGLTNRAVYHGWLNPEERASVFSKTLINILPSYNEGLPMTILETMAYGIPNFTTNIAAIPEAVVNKKNGILFNPGDYKALSEEILNIIDKENDRLAYSNECYKYIKCNFSIEEHVKKIVFIYKELLSQK